MYVYTKDMSASNFFFLFLPEQPIKIHLSAIIKGPENHLEHFVAIFSSKTGLPASGDSNFS